MSSEHVYDFSDRTLTQIDTIEIDNVMYRRTNTCNAGGRKIKVLTKHGKGTRKYEICLVLQPSVSKKSSSKYEDEDEDEDEDRDRKYFLGHLKEDPYEKEYLPCNLQPIPIPEDMYLTRPNNEEEFRQNLEKLNLLKGRYGDNRRAIFEWIKKSIIDYNQNEAQRLAVEEERNESLESQYTAKHFQYEHIANEYDKLPTEIFPLIDTDNESRCKNKPQAGFRIEVPETNNLQYIPPNWKILKGRIGDASTIGKAYLGCRIADQPPYECVGDEHYIIKIMKLDKTRLNTVDYLGAVDVYKFTMDAVLNEINNQVTASLLGLAPKIYDAFYCKSFLEKDGKPVKTIPDKLVMPTIRKNPSNSVYYIQKDKKTNIILNNCREARDEPGKIVCFVPTRMVYIVMDRLDVTVWEFRKIVGSVYDNFIYSSVRELFADLHNNACILHGDAHDSNVMFQFSPEARKIFKKVLENKKHLSEEEIRDRRSDFYDPARNFHGSKIMFIDFGKSVQCVKSEKCESYKRKPVLEAGPKGIKMTPGLMELDRDNFFRLQK